MWINLGIGYVDFYVFYIMIIRDYLIDKVFENYMDSII